MLKYRVSDQAHFHKSFQLTPGLHGFRGCMVWHWDRGIRIGPGRMVVGKRPVNQVQIKVIQL